jgi:hypothetical protein
MKSFTTKTILSLLTFVSLTGVAFAEESTQVNKLKHSAYTSNPSLAAKHPLASNTRSMAKKDAEILAKTKSESNDSVAQKEVSDSETGRARLAQPTQK